MNVNNLVGISKRITVYCIFLSVFSLAKKLHSIIEISATYRLVSYLPAIL